MRKDGSANTWGRKRVAEQSTHAGSPGNLFNAMRYSLKAGGSLVAIGCLLASGTAQAQDEPPASSDDESEIIVTGIRASLANTQEMQRNADAVVEAITAQGVGAHPDRSVAEAL